MSLYLALEQLKHLQVDHTTQCNLMCSQCARVVNGKRNPKLPHAELEAHDYEHLFTQLAAPLESLLFCGSYGDVAASQTFIESLKLVKTRTNAKITIMTNGSVRSTDWWEDLAHILDPQRDKVCWSIDGLKDTNPLYRINSNFDKIMENAQAFIGAGGRARWDYIAFGHNEHQVEEAQALAARMGFFMFSLKRTSRFITDPQFRESQAAQNVQVHYTPKGSSQIAIPKKESLVSNGHKSYQAILQAYSSWDNYIRETPIQCKFQQAQKLFVDFQMRLWPCTWLGSPIYAFDDKNSQKTQLLEIMSEFPENFNSLRHFSMREILGGPWFKSLLVESWQKNHPQRLVTCGRTCGDKYDYSASSKDNRDFISLQRENAHVV